jgi:hypothetical protein
MTPADVGGRLVAVEVKLDQVLEQLGAMASDLKELREAGIIRRLTDLETRDGDQDRRIKGVCDDQRDLRVEMRAALRILRWGVAVVAFASLIVVLLSNSASLLHWLGRL